MITIPFIHSFNSDRAGRWIEALNAYHPDLAVRNFSMCSEAERNSARVAIVGDPSLEDLRACPNLAWVQSLWAGVEGLVTTLSPDVDIVRMTDPQMARTMSESVLAWTLYLHRDMPTYRAQQDRRQWMQNRYVPPGDVSIAILGLGNMGRISAQRLHENGYHVTGWSRRPRAAESYTCVAGPSALGPLLSQSDVVVLLLPLTEGTRGLFNAGRLGQMKPGSALINFGRGGLVDEPALVSALDGHLGHAVLDVFATEPLPGDSPFWTHPNVTVLPHIAAETSKASAASIAMANIRAWLDTDVLPKAVDRKRGY